MKVSKQVVFHIPHSSHSIPKKMRSQFLLTDEELENELIKMTDRYTEELFTSGFACTKVCAKVSRLVVDVERFTEDAEEPMSKVGMGAVYTKTSDQRILREVIFSRERQKLLKEYFFPHHHKLNKKVIQVIRKSSKVLIIDCHSFSSVPLLYEPNKNVDRPDICIGTDPFHTPECITIAFVNAFREAGFTVKINEPYSGTIVPLEHYQKNPHVRSIIIEVNRKLYMNEKSGEKLPEFDAVAQKIQEVILEVLETNKAE